MYSVPVLYVLFIILSVFLMFPVVEAGEEDCIGSK